MDIPGVVDEAIHLIAIVESLDQASRGTLVGQIGLDELTGEAVGDGPGHTDHLVSVRRQSLGGGKAHPPAGAGDDHRSRHPVGGVVQGGRLLQQGNRLRGA